MAGDILLITGVSGEWGGVFCHLVCWIYIHTHEYDSSDVHVHTRVRLLPRTFYNVLGYTELLSAYDCEPFVITPSEPVITRLKGTQLCRIRNIAVIHII